MCGENSFPTFKNILIKGTIDTDNASISRNISLPFTPQLMEITSLSYIAGVINESGIIRDTIAIMTSSIIPESLISIPLTFDETNGITGNTLALHEKFNLFPSAQVQGLHTFTFNGINGIGLPPTTTIVFTMNLRFTA